VRHSLLFYITIYNAHARTHAHTEKEKMKKELDAPKCVLSAESEELRRI